jgi:hypothetical protein
VAPVITGGNTAGSSRVFGHGVPNIPDPLLKICSAGLNGIAEGCAPGTDDVLLGIGGTDGQGNFESISGIGVGLSRPLVAGEKIFAVDLQDNLPGPSVPVSPGAQIPDVNAWGAAALAVSLFIGIATRMRTMRSPHLRAPKP